MTTKDPDLVPNLSSENKKFEYETQLIPRYGKFLFLIKKHGDVIGSIELEDKEEVEHWNEMLNTSTK